MKYALPLLVLSVVMFKVSYSQTILGLRCHFYSDYKLDVTFNEEHSWRYVPIETDELFIDEHINVSKYKDTYSLKEFEKMRKKRLEEMGGAGISYAEELSQGFSNNNYFQDHVKFYSFDTHSTLIYYRTLYKKDGFEKKKKNHLYEISYKVDILSTKMGGSEKWEQIVPHFFEKTKKIKLLFNECS